MSADPPTGQTEPGSFPEKLYELERWPSKNQKGATKTLVHEAAPGGLGPYLPISGKFRNVLTCTADIGAFIADHLAKFGEIWRAALALKTILNLTALATAMQLTNACYVS